MADGRHLRLVSDALVERTASGSAPLRDATPRRGDLLRPAVWVAAIALCVAVYGLAVLVAIKLAESL